MREAWGKYDKERDIIHPLAHHCMDVAAVFERLIWLPVIRDRLDKAAGTPLEDVQRQRLAVMVFLHDIGKLHPGFQAKGWPRGVWQRPVRGHLREGWAFLIHAAHCQAHPFYGLLQRIKEWGETAVLALFAAAVAHHGRPVQPDGDPTDWDHIPHTPDYDWRTEALSLANVIPRWFTNAFQGKTAPLPNEARFHHLVAGLTALADWIGSDRRFFDYATPFDHAYDKTAHCRAARALEKIGLDTRDISSLPTPDFATLTNFPNPNPVQKTVGTVGPEAQLAILEADTGSGKTEAALWRFIQLFAVGKVSGLYFAVPTRAAARQIHGRIVGAMRRAFGEDAPEPVLAIPGILRAGEFDGYRLPGWKVKWDDENPPLQRWAAEHATRFLASTLAIGTVDQAMLASLEVKHAHMRGAALARSLLVVDEVHASDSYMTEILKRLLEDHLAVGGYALLMSATLGARARVQWTGDDLPVFKESLNMPYPAIWVKGEAKPRCAMSGRSKTVCLETVPTMNPIEIGKRAILAAEHGARVLVIRNTVTEAVKAWRTVLEVGAEVHLMQVKGYPALHHGRFAAEDRFLLDQAVEEALRPEHARKPNGCIVIGTQTLEQSLDIDADLLITDLCPMDVLLQRIGRLHRHDIRQRPTGYESPHAVILLPEGGLDRLTKPDFHNGLGAWGTPDGTHHGIYRDLAGLELTQRILAKSSEWHIPKMNRILVESTTHPECIKKLIADKGAAWECYERKIGGSELAEAMIGRLNALSREDRFEELNFPGSDERVTTRLSEEGIVLTIDPPCNGPFGHPIRRITLPAHWSQKIRKDDTVDVSFISEDSLVLLVGENRFNYGREGLSRDIGLKDE